MKRALVVLLFLVVSVGCQSKSASPGGSKSQAHHHGDGDDAAARTAVADTMKRYLDALLKKDMATLDRIWADDLVFVNPRGQVRTKAQRMADVSSGATAFKSIDSQDEVIKTCHGVAAIHISRGKLEGQYSGKESSGEFRITVALCREDNGEWRIHAIQMTPTTTTAAAPPPAVR